MATPCRQPPTTLAMRCDAAPGAHAWPVGAHLVTPRLGYTHHGIYVGGGRVVHYVGWSRALLRGPVEEVSLSSFAGGRGVSMKASPAGPYSPAEVVARARSRLGEDRYRLTTNNCEHFCEWCLSGHSRSEQVERLFGALRDTARAAVRIVEATCRRALRAPRGRSDGLTLLRATAAD